MDRMNKLLLLLWMVSATALQAAFDDKAPNLKDLPLVPEGFEVKLFAREPLVRNPCSMAFDPQGRMFVGMGPQYRNPKPDTPRDSVVMVLDENGDGVAERTQVFATGFNCIQGLAWHGRDLWIANSPDLTVVRDLDGDDVADEYVKVFTDLGNIEHALHGLVWAPDGRLYMSKGNSKGISIGDAPKEPGRIAPKAFRNLWGVKGPAEEAPSPVTFKAADYRNAYQDPRDDWGAQGGVLRCEDMGRNLEIISRGCRNPWDINLDSGFNWLGTDNDQNQGDRIIMPFAGANFGWSHAWSSGWTGEKEPQVAPASGPVFQGSGTGVVFADSPLFPKEYRGIWIINDWLRKTTFVYRPKWNGALITPEGGEWQPFISGKDALYRPTDMEFGADGALYVLGWGREYGGTFGPDGSQTNDGRIFRITPRGAAPLSSRLKLSVNQASIEALLGDLDAIIPARRIDAADELARRGEPAKQALFELLGQPDLPEMKQTWAVWTLYRAASNDAQVQSWLIAQAKSANSLNLRMQAVRILAQVGSAEAIAAVAGMMGDPEPRLRFETMLGICWAQSREVVETLLSRASRETDRMTCYAIWLAFRDLIDPARLKNLLSDSSPGVRRAALLALLDLGQVSRDELRKLGEDADEEMRLIVMLGLGLKPGATSAAMGAPFELARNINAESKRAYAAGFLRAGEPCYTDRAYVIKKVPELLAGAMMIRTANADDHSSGRSFITFEVPVDTTVYVAHDERVKERPDWLKDFADTDMTITTDDAHFHLWSKDFSPGKVHLGGNVPPGTKHKGFSHYFAVLTPRPLTLSGKLTTAEEVQKLTGSKERGEGIFFTQAGCANCHRIGQRGTNFGPDLTGLRDRMEPRFIVQSLLEPNAVITEGFAAHTVQAEGRSYFGILLEESGKALKLGLIDGHAVTVKKESITKHETLAASPMPPFNAMLTPQQAADVVAFLSTTSATAAAMVPVKPAAASDEWKFRLQNGVLYLDAGSVTLAAYHTRSDLIKRPFFANVRSLTGREMTRPFPVQLDPKNGGDHPDMHPGIWLGFGDLNGTDFWRNKGRIEHLSFTSKAQVKDGVASFTALNRFMQSDDQELGRQILRAQMQKHPSGWWLSLETELWSDTQELKLGPQEEMGLGIRLAPDLIEKAGGLVRNSLGDQGAKAAWGKPALWWDYSKDNTGILAMAHPSNPIPCWGHTRDYGVMVVNPTIRDKDKTPVVVKQGDHLKLRFEVLVHDSTAPFVADAVAADLLK